MLAIISRATAVHSPRPRAFAPLVGSVLVAAVLAGCQPQAAPAPAAPQVSVARVIERTVNDWDEFTGRIQAIDSVEVRPRVSGYIEKVAFTEGGLVKKGDLLFVIDPRPYRAELARAKADAAAAKTRAELARSEVARAERLLAVRAISQEEYDERVNRARETGAAVDAAVAAEEVARLNLEYTQIVSPIDGRVGKAEVTPGNLVGTGERATLLTTVVSGPKSGRSAGANAVRPCALTPRNTTSALPIVVKSPVT